MEIGPTKIDDNGKYMTLWKKQADGSWKVFSEIWNSSVEAPH
jgi:ketosteroid isomerase-like protein